MESIRKPTSDEIRIIRYLAEKAKCKLEASWESKLMVKPITDMRIGPVYLLFQSEFVEHIQGTKRSVQNGKGRKRGGMPLFIRGYGVFDG